MAANAGRLDVISATAADAARIMAFMMRRATIAMFPITNLRDHRMAGGHPKAMTFWLHELNGDIVDVLGVSDSGVVLPVFTSNTVPDIQTALAGIAITGVIGQRAGVEAVKVALGLPDGNLDRIEPHYELDLCDLKMPEVEGLTLLPVAAVSRETMIVWRTSYGIEALELSPSEASLQAIKTIDSMVANDSHRVLMSGDAPLAMTGFNSVLPENVMIGGVYTPEALRGRGYAKAALALHLQDAHVKGIKRAVLSAANESAAKAYAAIGFRQVGEFMIVFYTTPEVMHG